MTVDAYRTCSFCSKDRREVEFLIAGPGVCICDECVGLCVGILEEHRAEHPQGTVGASCAAEGSP